MNTETKLSVRNDALVVTIVLAALGLLWLVFGLYWQGLLLLLATSLVAYLGVRRSRGGDPSPDPSVAEPAADQSPKRARPDKARRGKKKRRRK